MQFSVLLAAANDIHAGSNQLVLKLLPAVTLVLLGLRPAAAPAQQGSPPSAGSLTRSESFQHLRERAEQGDAGAQYKLAVLYTQQGSAALLAGESFTWLRRAAEQGHVEAQADLGLLYYRGDGVPQDFAEAAKWIGLAAQQAHVEAQADLGQLYYRGEGVPRDFTQAAKWYQQAAEQGHTTAQYNLGGLYAAGEGVPRDLTESAEWYRKAAGAGLAEAQYVLALIYLRGAGVPKDPAEAARWARSAAALGYAPAQFRLALQYENGVGVNRDDAQAMRWFRVAAEQGHAEAQVKLAARYFRNDKHSKQAVQWYGYAAEQGLAEAQHILGLLYANGWGVTSDPVRAQMWFILAASGAHHDQRREYSTERDEARRGMTAQQIAEAQRLAARWEPKTWAKLTPGASRELVPADRFVDVEDFFASAGRNINAAEREYLEYWQSHIQESERRILEAARLVRTPQTALVLGAGRCREVPLEQLARKFDRVVLVDLDAPSMQEAVESLPADLHRKVEIRVSDVTSFAQPLMEATHRVIENAETAEQAFARLDAVYRDLEGRRRFPDLPAADLVISSLVLSELSRYPSTYAAQLVHRKFQARLSEWIGYGGLWKRLRMLTLLDHAELLARLCRPGGVVYYGDTVARGPDLSKASAVQRESTLASLAVRFAHIGLFKELRARPEAWSTFRGVFRALQGSEAPLDASIGSSNGIDPEQLIEGIETNPASHLRFAALAAEAATRMLCQGRLPTDLEVRAYEELAEAYRRSSPETLESLVEEDEFLSTLAARGLRPTGEPESWWWLEYACSIPRKPGAFLVRSWILQPADR